MFKPSTTVTPTRPLPRQLLLEPLRNSGKPVFSASDKAAQYFGNLQHSRKQFWVRYRHLLLPMIRTQIQKSARTRRTRTATSLKFRQTKRNGSLDNLKSSVASNLGAKKCRTEKTSPLRKYKRGGTAMMQYLAYLLLSK